MKSFRPSSVCLLIFFSAAPATSFVPTTSLSAPPAASSSAICATAPHSRRAALATISTTFASAAFVATTANALETYLTEPTEEFKESERQRMEFRKKQLLLKGEFVKVLARLTGESSTEDELVKDLVELRELVIATGGLPLGIKKEDMYKVIRSKKAKGFWPTNVEIAYQKLKSEVAYQQSPNTEKDMENPL